MVRKEPFNLEISFTPPKITFYDTSYKNTFITDKVSTELRSKLVSGFQHICTWNLIFSNYEHGTSYETLLRKFNSTKGAYVLIITTQENEIFGAFFTEKLSYDMHGFGKSDTFLWKTSENNGELAVKEFRSTGKNNLFIICNPDFLAFGCSDGKYGLFISRQLSHGRSACVNTFDNEKMSSKDEFKIKRIEIMNITI